MPKAITAPAPYPAIRPWVFAGLAIVVLSLGGIFTWAAIATISGAVVGQGLVVVESNIKTVQHLDGGIVAEIRVRNGDRVKEGDVIVRLDETAARSNLAIVVARLNELLIQRARLDAEHSGAEAVEVPLGLESQGPAVASFIAAQRSLFAARRERQRGEIGLLRQQIAQLGETAAGMTEELDGKQRQSRLIKSEIQSVMPLLEQGLYTASKMLALEREAARLDGEIGRLRGDIARTRTTISETELKITQVQKETMQQVFTDLRDAQGKIAELEEQRVAIDDKLKRIEIRAPRAGIVHNLAVHTVGGVVAPGNPIMEVVPEEDRPMIEVRISPNDIDQVRVGQPATVRFPTFNQRTTPVLDGSVVNRSAAQLLDRATGLSYFTAMVELQPTELVKLGSGKSLIPGMQAEIFLETEPRTVLSYLVKPMLDQIERVFKER